MPVPPHAALPSDELTRHRAPLAPPGRRGWMVAGLLVALTVLPTLVVIFAGQAALRGPELPPPGSIVAAPPVVVDPGTQSGRLSDPAPAEQAPVTPSTPTAPPTARGEGAGAPTPERMDCPPTASPTSPSGRTPGAAGRPDGPSGDDDSRDRDGSGDDSGDSGDDSRDHHDRWDDDDSWDDDEPEDAPGEEFTERVFEELGLPVPR